MTTFTRKSAWDRGGTFDNTDLEWYAKGVGKMQSRSLDDPNSWWFFAAIHGEYVDQNSFPGWGSIPGPPAVPNSPKPSNGVRDKFWNQCQHQSWYFPPWHRGYLIALEAQLRSAIVDLGGPSDWSLPYWNYLGSGNRYQIPPAFMNKNLSDGTPNPLYVHARFGPRGTGTVYVQIPPVNQACQKNTVYTGSNSATSLPGYGGPKTSFWHGGGRSGNLESNPHNLVHVQVGGQASANLWGLMADPGLAALDPVFYLHHANIDRLWAAWNGNGNSNPTDQSWINGPTASGAREFVMPMPDGTDYIFAPGDVSDLNQLNYTYDNLQPAQVTKPDLLTARFSRLGIEASNIFRAELMDEGESAELFGANDQPLKLSGHGVKTQVNFDAPTWRKVPESFRLAASPSEPRIPDQVYLQIENVTGELDANMLAVSVNQKHAGDVSLFGLRNASKADGHEGGTGLTFILNITDIIDELHIDDQMDINSLEVMIHPNNEIPEDKVITIGRVSMYREQHR